MVLERLKNMTKYFVDKLEDVGEKEVNSLPHHIRDALVYGSGEQKKEAMSDLNALERMRGERLLTTAGKEYIADLISTKEIYGSKTDTE